MVSRRFLDLRKLCEVTRPRITTFSPSGMLEMEMMSPAVSYRKGRWHSRSPRDTMPSSFNFAAVAGPTPFKIVTGSARTQGGSGFHLRPAESFLSEGESRRPRAGVGSNNRTHQPSEANVHIAVSGQQHALQLLHLLRSISVGNTHIHRLLRISALKEVGLHLSHRPLVTPNLLVSVNHTIVDSKEGPDIQQSSSDATGPSYTSTFLEILQSADLKEEASVVLEPIDVTQEFRFIRTSIQQDKQALYQKRNPQRDQLRVYYGYSVHLLLRASGTGVRTTQQRTQVQREHVLILLSQSSILGYERSRGRLGSRRQLVRDFQFLIERGRVNLDPVLVRLISEMDTQRDHGKVGVIFQCGWKVSRAVHNQRGVPPIQSLILCAHCFSSSTRMGNLLGCHEYRIQGLSPLIDLHIQSLKLFFHPHHRPFDI